MNITIHDNFNRQLPPYYSPFWEADGVMNGLSLVEKYVACFVKVRELATPVINDMMKARRFLKLSMSFVEAGFIFYRPSKVSFKLVDPVVGSDVFLARFELELLPGNGSVVLSHSSLIHPEFQGRGHATRLHDAKEYLARIMTDDGCCSVDSVLLCTVNAENAGERRVLEKRGWNVGLEVYPGCLLYRKQLDRAGETSPCDDDECIGK